MNEKRIINIGDGRIVEMTEAGELPAQPAKRQRIKNPGSKAGLRKKSERPAKRPENESKANNHLNFQARNHIPGNAEWVAARRVIGQKLAIGKPKSRLGIPDGMRRAEAEEAWAVAREKARKDMVNLKRAGIIDPTEERAEEAMLATLQIMHGPMNQAIRLQAAHQVLEWTKGKPTSRSEVTVNAAETWLASLAEDDQA